VIRKQDHPDLILVAENLNSFHCLGVRDFSKVALGGQKSGLTLFEKVTLGPVFADTDYTNETAATHV
jgi:hypothetical protein